MEQVKAPEKLYITNDETRFGDKCHSASTEKYIDNDIEYIRKDVVIERACEWIRDNHLKYPSEDCADTVKFIKDFKRYLKRE